VEAEKTKEELLQLLEEKELLLEEANDTINAIRAGEIDALIFNREEGHQIFTVSSADHAFRIFIQQMNEGAITLNRDGIILYCNSSFAALIGMPLEKIIGRPFSQYIDPDMQHEWVYTIVSAWTNDLKVETLLQHPDYRKVPVILSLKTLHLADGLALSIIITDLSQQKETQSLLENKNAQLEAAQKVATDLNANLEKTVEQRTETLRQTIAQKTKIAQDLRSNEEQLSRILETMAEGVLIRDLSGCLTYANPMAQKILGIWEDSELPGCYLNPDWPLLWVNGEDLPEGQNPIDQTINTGQPVYDYEIAVQPPKAERFYISVNAAPIRDDEGKVIAGIATFMDVTHRRKAIQQKDDFISVASHELRTPITSLKASLQLMDKLKDRPDAAMMPKLIAQANKSMGKMSVLIEDLLNTTKMTEGHLVLNKRRINLWNLIDDCSTEILADDSFKVSVEGDFDAEIYADGDKIEQVIVNFISNAIKYAPSSKTIRVTIEKGQDMTKVSVIDRGPGIPALKLPYIFERYYRVESDGIQYSGLGLGLYISAQIIEKHGGKIGADSIFGEGSTFWCSLPNAAV
jgi:two-component system phosphate regulon sensor histidine kinase PhoR